MTTVIGARLEDKKGQALNKYIKEAGYPSTSEFIRDCVDKVLKDEDKAHPNEDFNIIRMALDRIEQRCRRDSEEQLLIDIGRTVIEELKKNENGSLIQEKGIFVSRVSRRRVELIRGYVEMMGLPFVSEG